MNEQRTGDSSSVSLLDRAGAHPVTRRTLTRSLAWTAPAIAVGAAAPAFGASPVACPPVPTGSQWRVTTSTGVNTAPASASGATIRMYRDSTSRTSNGVVVMSATFQATAGVTYNFEFDMQSAKGYMSVGGCQTINTTVAISVGNKQLVEASTQSGYPGTLIAPPSNCTSNGTRDSQLSAVQTLKGSYTATSGGSVTITMQFTVTAGTNSGNNDDWTITTRLASCTI